MKRTLPFTSLCVLLNLALFSQVIENGGFENWEDVGTVMDEPVDWSSLKTSDVPSLNTFAPVVWDRSEDAHTGNFSVKLTNVYVSIAGITATGTITTGRIHADFNPELGYSYTNPADPQWNNPCNKRPDSLVGWYKFFPQGEDFGKVHALLHVGDAQIPENGTLPNWVGEAIFLMEPGVTVDTWTRFAVPFVYFDERNPEYILMLLNSGNGTTPVANSYALFDDLKIVGESLAVRENPFAEFTVDYSNQTLIFRNLKLEMFQHTTVSLYDLTGRLIWDSELHSPIVSMGTFTADSGIYILRLQSDEAGASRKIFVH